MNKLLKNVLAAFLIGCVVFVIGNSLTSKGFDFENTNQLLTNFGFYQLYSFLLGFTNMSFFQFLERLKWKETETIKRVVLGLFGSLALTIIGLFFLHMFEDMYLKEISFKEFIADEDYRNYTFGIWITMSIVVTYYAIYFYKKSQDKKVKESQIVAKTETAKFESLKNQLDPHFLFNSLNVLTSLIGENPNQAEKFTTKLSKVYRYVLEQKDKDLISLEEELKFAKSYMQLLQMRFEEAVHFDIPDVVSNPELKIVPLSLQLLLENAVKHNVITSEQPLEIKIYEKEGFLIVENNSNPKASLEKSTKVGLKNITQRYSLITKAQVEISKTSTTFTVALPLLTQEIKKMKTDYINDNEKYIRAKKRVDELKGFYAGLISYCIVIPFLAFINYQTTGWHHKWFLYPAAGWGLGVAIHAFTVFGYTSNWEDRKIREIMEKDKFNS